MVIPASILAPVPGEGAAAYTAVCAALHARTFPDPWGVAAFTGLLADPLVRCWVGRDPGTATPAALLLCRMVVDEAEILTIGTLPQCRRQGWARRLLEAARPALTAAGVGQWFLEVAADNTPARRFYQDQGFTQVGVRKGYYPPPFPGEPVRDALVLACPLFLS